MVYLNLHKGSSAAASFLQKASEEASQPASATASDVLRDIDRPVAPEEALNGMYERKTQMPMVYLNLHKGSSAAASFLQKAFEKASQPASAAASDVLRDIDRPAAPEEALNGMYERK